MKKVLFIAVATAAILGLSSCKQSTCTCEEFYSGELTKVDLSNQDMIDSCGEYEDFLNGLAYSMGYRQNWSCE